MMIDNHSKSTAKVTTAVSEAGIEAKTPKLDVDQQKMLDEIKASDVVGIDAIYLAHQKTVHDAALALHKEYAASGDTPSLKKVASEVMPVVEAHRAELAKPASKR